MAAGNFDYCLHQVLRHEGGYSNHPADKGGETMYGITKAVARANGYNGPMRDIPMSLVCDIYRRKYWDAAGCDSLNAGVDLAVFDFAVNSGPSRARAFLLKSIGGSDSDTINRLCDARMAFLKALPDWRYFGRGWTRRVSEVRRVSLAMVGGPSRNIAPPPPPPPDVEPPASAEPIRRPFWRSLLDSIRSFLWRKS